VVINITNTFNGSMAVIPLFKLSSSTNTVCEFSWPLRSMKFQPFTTMRLPRFHFEFRGNPANNFNWTPSNLTFVGNGTVNVSNVLE